MAPWTRETQYTKQYKAVEQQEEESTRNVQQIGKRFFFILPKLAIREYILH
jgi:hypothetical protein